MIQGNKGTFGKIPAIGYSPEITDGVFRLYAMIVDGAGTNRLLIHEHKLRASEKYHTLLEGHAREMMASILKPKDMTLNAHHFTRSLEDIATRLADETTSDLERQILNLPEGTKIILTSWHNRNRDKYSRNPDLTYRRSEAYASWKAFTIENGTGAVVRRVLGDEDEIMFESGKSKRDDDYKSSKQPPNEMEMAERMQRTYTKLVEEMDSKQKSRFGKRHKGVEDEDVEDWDFEEEEEGDNYEDGFTITPIPEGRDNE